MEKKLEVDLLDLATILAKRKKTLIISILLITAIGFVLALIWPKSYKSELSFIVTDGNAINFSGSGLLSGLAGIGTSSSSVTADQVLVLIRNKEIQNRVIEEFNMREVFGTDIPEILRKKLDNQILINEKREGGLGFNNIIAIGLAYIDAEPERAFEILNYYYNEVEKSVEELNRENIEDGFLLLENRLMQNEEDLKIAEDSLVSFQAKYGILEIEEQAKTQVQTLALLKSEIVKLDIQIGYLTSVFGENSSKISELKLQKKELSIQYDELLNGKDSMDKSFDIFQSASEMPGLFLEYLRRYREVVVQEEIYKALFPQYEQQKLNYQEVSSGLKIIDPALIPTYKDSPKRAYIVIASFLLSCFMAFLIIFFKEWKDKLESEDSEGQQRLVTLMKSLRNW